jgi:hypothetical protein
LEGDARFSTLGRASWLLGPPPPLSVPSLLPEQIETGTQFLNPNARQASATLAATIKTATHKGKSQITLNAQASMESEYFSPSFGRPPLILAWLLRTQLEQFALPGARDALGGTDVLEIWVDSGDALTIASGMINAIDRLMTRSVFF